MWTDGRTDRRRAREGGRGGAAPANTPRSAAPRGTARETETRGGSEGPGRKATLAALGSHLENKSVTNSADAVLIARRAHGCSPACRHSPACSQRGSPAPTPGPGGSSCPPSTARAERSLPPAAPRSCPAQENASGELSQRHPFKLPKPGPPRAPSPGSPTAPTCPGLPGAAEGPGRAGLGSGRALLAVRVAHEAALASTAAGWRAPRCYMAEPSGLRRGPGGPGRRRLSAAGSHPSSGPGGAQRSQAAVPEPMVRAERRGLQGSPGGSHSTLPAPSLRRGCLGDTERLSGLKGGAPVAKHR